MSETPDEAITDEAPPPPPEGEYVVDRSLDPADAEWNRGGNGPELWSDRLPLWDPRRTVHGEWPPIDPTPPEAP
jgi:hypothetical protein